MTLALRWRPKTFEDVVGQGPVRTVLKAMVASGDLPPSLIFCGSRGTGKTTTARILSAALNCTGEMRPCQACASCEAVAATNSIDVLEIDAASNGLVDDIRKLKEVLMYQTSGRWRIALLDEAHSMSREAFNALLKVLEEPPDRTLFIMATTEPGKIIDTVASRSMTFEFRRISMENICKRLRHIANEEGIQADDDLLTEIAQRAQGGMRDAVMLLDQCWRLKATSAAHFRDQFGIHDVSVPLMGAALEANFAEGSRIIEDHFYRVGDAAQLMTDLTLLTRDLLVIRSGGTPQGLMEREMDERRELAARAETAGLVNAMRVLWDLKTKVRHVDNDQRAAMEMAFVMVADALNRIGSSGNNGAGAPKQEERKLSFAEMQRIAANR
jgi:DNA polymerase-3 subunit gamma/tau